MARLAYFGHIPPSESGELEPDEAFKLAESVERLHADDLKIIGRMLAATVGVRMREQVGR